MAAGYAGPDLPATPRDMQVRSGMDLMSCSRRLAAASDGAHVTSQQAKANGKVASMTLASAGSNKHDVLHMFILVSFSQHSAMCHGSHVIILRLPHFSEACLPCATKTPVDSLLVTTAGCTFSCCNVTLR